MKSGTGGGSRSGFGRTWRLALAGVAALALVAAALGWSPLAALASRLTIATDDIISERQPDEVYEAVFPRYVEICATSQWRKLIGRQGNPFGHAVIYLKGACRDASAPYPQLRRCRPGDPDATAAGGPEHGAGVSVGRFFRNVNWVAIPGRDMMLDGIADPDEPITEELVDRTVRHAIDAGIFDGVELHPPFDASDPASLSEFVAAHSVGTDYGLRYARNVFCARTPITETQLDEAIAFLNEKNREYATGEADYEWSLFNHNCVHTVRNALAAANLWSPISVGEVKLRALLNLAVPANEFVNLALRGADGPLEDVGELMADGPARDALHEFGWLPRRPGALVKFVPAREPNEMFDPEFRLFAVQSLLRMGVTADVVRLLSDPVHTDLEANLRHFDELYAGMEARLDATREPFAAVHGDPLRRAERLHADYLRAERAETTALLERALELKAVRTTEALR